MCATTICDILRGDMTEFLLHIEQSGFSQWVRESDSLFAYSGVLLMHTIGMGFVVGINACIDLRILGSLRHYA